jgi:ribonuclease I
MDEEMRGLKNPQRGISIKWSRVNKHTRITKIKIRNCLPALSLLSDGHWLQHGSCYVQK